MSLMSGEIRDIPGCVRRLLDEGAAQTADVAAAVSRSRPRWVSVAGRGTSDHAATYARYVFETCLGLPAGLAAPSVTSIYRSAMDWRGGLMVGVSRSGRTEDVVAVLRQARIGGACTVAVTNDPDSPLAAVADHVLPCHAGVEQAAPASKTYVLSLVAVASLVAAMRPTSVIGGVLDRLPAALDHALELSTDWLATSGAVDSFASCERAVVTSRGFNLATAREVAFKLKETGGIYADGYSAADIAHGPASMTRPGAPVLAFRPDGEMGVRIDESLGRAVAAGGRPYVVRGSDSPTGALADGASAALSLPTDLPECLTPALFVIPGQLLAEAVAVTRGINPDLPPDVGQQSIAV